MLQFLAPDIYQTVTLLATFLLKHGGVTSSDLLYSFFNKHPAIPVAIKELIQNRNIFALFQIQFHLFSAKSGSSTVHAVPDPPSLRICSIPVPVLCWGAPQPARLRLCHVHSQSEWNAQIANTHPIPVLPQLQPVPANVAPTAVNQRKLRGPAESGGRSWWVASVQPAIGAKPTGKCAQPERTDQWVHGEWPWRAWRIQRIGWRRRNQWAGQLKGELVAALPAPGPAPASADSDHAKANLLVVR